MQPQAMGGIPKEREGVIKETTDKVFKLLKDSEIKVSEVGFVFQNIQIRVNEMVGNQKL